jgi:DNA-binding winged helix-turn-helix (wHTH) protein
MDVNSASKGFFNNRFALASGIAIVGLTIFFIASSFTRRPDRNLRSKQGNLIVREIGHRLLLQSGDLTSRVLPVTEIREGTFLLTFEKNFAFDHVALITLAHSLLPKTEFPSGYTVTVHECLRKESIVYGFQINNGTPDIVACKGRLQPRGCYSIEIAFTDFYEASSNYTLIGLVGSGMLAMLSVGLLIGRFGKASIRVPVENQGHSVIKESVQETPRLGEFLFDVKGQRLLLESEVITLTEKECRVLELLNANFGELIPRETLMEKIWINEGVITGRSLDMFVSKLRKKLRGDPTLRITNIHGKGYRLEMVDQHGQN